MGYGSQIKLGNLLIPKILYFLPPQRDLEEKETASRWMNVKTHPPVVGFSRGERVW